MTDVPQCVHVTEVYISPLLDCSPHRWLCPPLVLQCMAGGRHPSHVCPSRSCHALKSSSAPSKVTPLLLVVWGTYFANGNGTYLTLVWGTYFARGYDVWCVGHSVWGTYFARGNGAWCGAPLDVPRHNARVHDAHGSARNTAAWCHRRRRVLMAFLPVAAPWYLPYLHGPCARLWR